MLILLVGNVVFALINLNSGIVNAVEMGISDHPILQIATGAICVLNVVLVYLVLRQSKWSAYALVTGLLIATVLFALTLWAAYSPADPPGEKTLSVVASVISFIVGLVITVVSAMVLRTIMRQPARQFEPPASPSMSASDSEYTQEGVDSDKG